MAKQTTWFRLDPADLLIEALESSPKEWYRRTIMIAKALVKEERGKDPFADRMLDNAAAYIEQRRNAGRQSGITRSARPKTSQRNGERNANETTTERERNANETTTERERNANETTTDKNFRSNGAQNSVRHARALTDGTNKQYKPMDTMDTSDHSEEPPPPPAPPGPVGPSDHRPSGKKPRGESIGPSDGGGEPFDRAAMEADPYAYLHGVPVRRLPEFAAWYCGEADNAEAKRRYGGFIKAHGAVAFYRMLEEFIGEVRSGEVPDNMGAVLTSRVKEAWR